jgi:hypothetical protein
MMDLRDTIQPKSDQLNAEDLVSGPMDVTITEVRRGNPEQPVELHLAGIQGRPFKPCKSVRRLLVACWGHDGSQWAGRSLRLFCDDTVEWGGKRVGGIRVSHVSHINQPRTLLLSVKRGKRKPVTVQPMPAAQVAPELDLLEVLARREVSMAQLDEWAQSKGKPLVSGLDAAGQAKVAAWLASPAANASVEEMHAATG